MSKPDFQNEWLDWYKEPELTKWANTLSTKKVAVYKTIHRVGNYADKYVLIDEKSRITDASNIDKFKQKAEYKLRRIKK